MCRRATAKQLRGTIVEVAAEAEAAATKLTGRIDALDATFQFHLGRLLQAFRFKAHPAGPIIAKDLSAEAAALVAACLLAALSLGGIDAQLVIQLSRLAATCTSL